MKSSGWDRSQPVGLRMSRDMQAAICLSVCLSVRLAGWVHDFPCLCVCVQPLPPVICQAASLLSSLVGRQAALARPFGLRIHARHQSLGPGEGISLAGPGTRMGSHEAV